MAWAYIAVYLGMLVVSAVTTLRRDPELIAERSRVKPGTKGWDKVLSNATMFGVTGSILVAGLDVRFGWTAGFNLALELAALALVALGFALLNWAMSANRFFSAVVRIQTERGHTVATGGPYRYVRHPGYVAMILVTLMTAPALGSLWALIPAGIGAGGTILRTVLEDATLQAELPGYREYTRQVRYRLVPGLW
ncbi:MAG TPA: isoprenylcysteine carboxylmethyltransferase family protein [Symbiobacteriaceae bacterium]|jgi:protein-S-isoprenylcysteine O-methyltransferase Ste14